MYRADVNFKRELKLPFHSRKNFLPCKIVKFLTMKNTVRNSLQMAGANYN